MLCMYFQNNNIEINHVRGISAFHFKEIHLNFKKFGIKSKVNNIRPPKVRSSMSSVLIIRSQLNVLQYTIKHVKRTCCIDMNRCNEWKCHKQITSRGRLEVRADGKLPAFEWFRKWIQPRTRHGILSLSWEYL